MENKKDVQMKPPADPKDPASNGKEVKTCTTCGQTMPISEYDHDGMPSREEFEKMDPDTMRKYLPVKNNDQY